MDDTEHLIFAYKLQDALMEFYREFGVGQYTHHGFACWLVENEPYLTADILAPVLERLFAKENTTPVEEVV